MNLIEKINEIISLTESFYDSFKTLDGKIVEIFKNPSSSEYMQTKKISGVTWSARGFFTGKDVYMWRGDVFHSEVEKYLKIAWKLIDAEYVTEKRIGIGIYTGGRKRLTIEKTKELGNRVKKFATDLKNAPISLEGIKI